MAVKANLRLSSPSVEVGRMESSATDACKRFDYTPISLDYEDDENET